jgi:hypothetical protein
MSLGVNLESDSLRGRLGGLDHVFGCTKRADCQMRVLLAAFCLLDRGLVQLLLFDILLRNDPLRVELLLNGVELLPGRSRCGDECPILLDIQRHRQPRLVVDAGRQLYDLARGLAPRQQHLDSVDALILQRVCVLLTFAPDHVDKEMVHIEQGIRRVLKVHHVADNSHLA